MKQTTRKRLRRKGPSSKLTALGMMSLMAAGCASQSVDVRQYGNMREVLSGGAATAQPRVSLSDALATPHAYAVGALPGLEGEITVLDGEAWIARCDGNGLRVDGPRKKPADQAAMLTIAHVGQWKEFPLEAGLSGDALEAAIADAARRNGMDTSQPFPFVIEGALSDLQAHVIHGACPMRPGARLAADQQPWRYQLAGHHASQAVTVVGFFAPDSVGVITHPGTSVHAHAIVEANGRTVTGHVERMASAPGATLRLPVVTTGSG